MKTYEIPILWESFKIYEVEAKNLQEAVTKALSEFLSTPDDNYLQDSFDIDAILQDTYPEEEYDIVKAIETIYK